MASSNEEDPKEVAKKELRTPEAQKLLRQFVNTDGPKGNSAAYQEGWERTFGKKSYFCDACGTSEGMGEEDILCEECWEKQESKYGPPHPGDDP